MLQLEGNDSLDQTVDTVAITVSDIVTLSVTSVGPGSVTLNPPGGSYSFGQTVTRDRRARTRRRLRRLRAALSRARRTRSRW